MPTPTSNKTAWRIETDRLKNTKKAARTTDKGKRFMSIPCAGAYLVMRSAQSLASIMSCLARLGTLSIGKAALACVQSTIEPA